MRSIFYALISLTSGNTLKLIKQCRKSKNGFEACRLLVRRHNPRVGEIPVALLGNICDFQFGKFENSLDNLVTWQNSTDNYEREAEEEMS